MQQPFAVPDECADDGEPYPPAAPRLSAEELAEQSALAVFPGDPSLTSDQWWRQGDPAHEAELASEARATPEPAPLATFPTPDARTVAPVDAAEWGNDDDQIAEPAPRRLWSTPDAAPDPQPLDDGIVDADVTAFPVSPPANTAHPDDVPRLVLSLPGAHGRKGRQSAGASQRAAILAQAGVALEPESLDDPTTADGQLAIAIRGRAAAPASAAMSNRSGRRQVSLSLLIIVLAVVALSGGAIATGQRAEVERVASTLAPDVLERWISDRVSSFGDVSPIPIASSPLGAPAPPSAANATVLIGQIAHTGGAGVPVRSTCVPEARTPRTLSEGAPVTVIAQGVGDCSGWSVVRAGAAVSWVESAYIEAVPAP